MLYCLRKLLELRLWPGSLWAALSNNPSQYSIELPGMKFLSLPFVHRSAVRLLDNLLSQTTRQLIADSVKRSTIAHLFHFYPLLCEIVSIPRKTPFFWTQQQRSGQKPPIRHGENYVNGKETGEVFGEGDWITVGLDARDLARDCLKEIGKEMGF